MTEPTPTEKMDALAWEELREDDAPPDLRVAAWQYVYDGDRRPFLRLLKAAAEHEQGHR